jgi:hypothetical protein
MAILLETDLVQSLLCVRTEEDAGIWRQKQGSFDSNGLLPKYHFLIHWLCLPLLNNKIISYSLSLSFPSSLLPSYPLLYLSLSLTFYAGSIKGGQHKRPVHPWLPLIVIFLRARKREERGRRRSRVTPVLETQTPTKAKAEAQTREEKTAPPLSFTQHQEPSLPPPSLVYIHRIA